MSINFADSPSPQNLEAEQAVLGACLFDGEAIHRVADRLAPTDFYSDKHGDLWGVMLEMRAGGQPIDAVTVTATLRNGGKLESIGGGPYLAYLLNMVPTANNVEAYAAIVGECSWRRLTARTLRELERQTGDMGIPAADVQKKISQRTMELLAQRGERGLTAPLNILEWLDAQRDGAAARKLTPTGLISLDSVCPLKDGKLYIVAGRTSMGKTGWLTWMHRGITKADPQAAAALFSLEMDEDAYYPRIIAPEAGLDIQALELGRLKSEDEWERAYAAAAKLLTVPLLMDYTSDRTSEQIYGECLRAKSRGVNLRAVLVDYLQLMGDEPSRKNEQRYETVGRMTSNLKRMSKELHVPVVVAAQLSRETDKRHNKVPVLSDLRESGNIEQDADAVLFVHRPDYYDPADRPNWLQIVIAKQRNGRVGDLWFKYYRDTGRIIEEPMNTWPK